MAATGQTGAVSSRCSRKPAMSSSSQVAELRDYFRDDCVISRCEGESSMCWRKARSSSIRSAARSHELLVTALRLKRVTAGGREPLTQEVDSFAEARKADERASSCRTPAAVRLADPTPARTRRARTKTLVFVPTGAPDIPWPRCTRSAVPDAKYALATTRLNLTERVHSS